MNNINTKTDWTVSFSSGVGSNIQADSERSAKTQATKLHSHGAGNIYLTKGLDQHGEPDFMREAWEGFNAWGLKPWEIGAG